MTSEVEAFLTSKEEQEIVEAIRKAEKNTSGEIRVHLENSTSDDHFKRALEVFYLLKMDATKNRNGVLIYVAVHDKKFVIYGDEGIAKVVPNNFWESTKAVMEHYFKKGLFKQGIVEGVLKAGKELKTHFPWQTDDVDELSNEISKS